MAGNCFKVGNPGNTTTDKCCTPPGYTRTVTVQGCNSLALPGATVQLKSGSTVLDTQTANGSGVATFTGVAAGSYTWSVTDASGRFATTTSAVTVSGAGSSTVNMTVASGYHCCSGCVYPIADTLTLGTTQGSVTVTWNSGTSKWTGNKTVSVTSYAPTCPRPNPLCDSVSHGANSVTFQFTAQCIGGGAISLLGASAFVCQPLTCPYPPGTYIAADFLADSASCAVDSTVRSGPGTVNLSGSCSTPYSGSGTLASSWSVTLGSGVPQTITNPFAGSVTWSE